MTLQNLLAIGQLQAHTTDAEAVRRMLDAARRALADARIDTLGNNSRFDLAYKCVMQCAMLGLWVNGYRVSSNQPGHHQAAIQCLALTLGVPAGTVIVLDRLRQVRNVNDYAGDPVSRAALASCIDEAGKLLDRTERWLEEHRPDLIRDS